MNLNNINILCTRPLPESLIKEAAMAGIHIKSVAFIATEPIQSIEVQQEIEQAFLQNGVVVFTSMNAVEAVVYYLENHQPDWQIFCIGNTTFQLVRTYFGEDCIAGTAADAESLAQLIVEERSRDEVIFFCGDQRRQELPEILRSNDFEVNEIVVYQTIPLPQKITGDYDGILFFSPSAVQSFFQKNQLPPTTVLFAIGNTTATEIKKYTTNKIIIAHSPGKENLVKKMIEYFK